MFKLGRFSLQTVLFGTFKLDGGAMFGTVPKALWQRSIQADEMNRITLAARGLLIKSEQNTILIDTGFGNKWDAKAQNIFEFHASSIQTSNVTSNLFPPKDSIDTVILTHLHFDHAGGVSYYDKSQALQLTYKNATHILQHDNWCTASQPNSRERSSYLKENITPLEAGNLELVNGETEVFPGLSVIPCHGHTKGMQWIKLTQENQVVAFPSDLIPTTHHIRIPYIMGYDLCASTTLIEKQSFLAQAADEDWIVIFQHDPTISAGRIGRTTEGDFFLHSKLDI